MVEYITIASYCSRAGVAFLKSTPEVGGMLFGMRTLVIMLKGYSWLAKIQLIASVSYEGCLAPIYVTNSWVTRQCSVINVTKVT